VADFESQVFEVSIQVDNAMYERFFELVKILATEQHSLPTPLSTSEISALTEQVHPIWLPRLRDPNVLYKAYLGDFDRLTVASRNAALSDLQLLNVPSGLSKHAFTAYVGAVLLQIPLISKLDRLLISPQRFGAVSQFIRMHMSQEDLSFDADRAWQTLMRWLLYFLPHRYGVRQPNHSEVFYRIDQ
jgi:hypothetical protein